MNGVKYALDTVTAIRILNDSAPQAKKRTEEVGYVALPMAVVAELLFGAMNSGRRDENLAHCETFVGNAVTISPDVETARRYAALRLQLKRNGQMIPINDLWIAATCLAHGLTLVTEDAHFDRCEGLRTENWIPQPG